MKRKILTLSCTIALCFSLTSCGLKSAITGDKTANIDNLTTTETDSENQEEISTDKTSENSENEKENKTNDSDKKTSNNTVLATNNSLVEDTNSSTIDKSKTSSINNIVNRNCRIFYFNKVDLKTYCIDTSIEVTDNALVTALTEKLHSSPNNNNNFVVLSKDYGVSSATLNYDTNILTVVFNENFIEDMELSTEVANGVIGAIINTYGYNYGIDKVSIYFGDELYTGIDGTSSSGYSTVNYADTLKLN